MNNIKENLVNELIVHDEAKVNLIRRISYYLNVNKPEDILKINIYGLSKTGKTFTSELIINSIFKQSSPGYMVYSIPSNNISVEDIKQNLDLSIKKRMKICNSVILIVVDSLTMKYKNLSEMISIEDLEGRSIIVIFLYTLSNEEYYEIKNNTKNNNNNINEYSILFHPYYREDVVKILIHKWNEYLFNEKSSQFNLIDINIDDSIFEFIANPETGVIEYYEGENKYSQNIFEIESKIIKSIYQICNCFLSSLTHDYSKISMVRIYYNNEIIIELYDGEKKEFKVIKSKEKFDAVLLNYLSTSVIDCNVFL